MPQTLVKLWCSLAWFECQQKEAILLSLMCIRAFNLRNKSFIHFAKGIRGKIKLDVCEHFSKKTSNCWCKNFQWTEKPSCKIELKKFFQYSQAEEILAIFPYPFLLYICAKRELQTNSSEPWTFLNFLKSVRILKLFDQKESACKLLQYPPVLVYHGQI